MNVFETVCRIVADSLYLDDASEIQPNSKLIADLGAESIDFLDIIFRLEETFGVKIPKGEVNRRAKEGLEDDEFAINGVLQAKGLERMREIMSEVDPAEFKPGLKLHDIPSLYTIETLVKLVTTGSTSAPATTTAVPAAAIVGQSKTPASNIQP